MGDGNGISEENGVAPEDGVALDERAGAPGERELGRQWASDMLRLVSVLAVIFGSLGFGGWLGLERYEDMERIGALRESVLHVRDLGDRIAIWLEAEELHHADGGGEHGAVGDGRMLKLVEALSRRHDANVALAWELGIAGDLSARPSDVARAPVQRIDILVRSFLHRLQRLTETAPDRRARTRADLLRDFHEQLRPVLTRTEAVLSRVADGLERDAQRALALGGAGGFVGVGMMLWLHLRGPRRRLDGAIAAREAAEAELARTMILLRGAERDRVRMLNLAASGLIGAAERMEGAAELLARTPLAETQSRVLGGLRAALDELRCRLDGQLLLCAFGDGRLRGARRPMAPGAICAEWEARAAERVVAEGRRFVGGLELDPALEVRGDAMMLVQALDRLLDDALRRTAKEGRICIAGRFERLERGAWELRFLLEHDGAAPGPGEVASIRGPFSERPPSTASLPRGADPMGLPAVAAIGIVAGGGLEVAGGADGGARMTLRMRFDALDAAEDFGSPASGSAPAAGEDRTTEFDFDAAVYFMPSGEEDETTPGPPAAGDRRDAARRSLGDRRRGTTDGDGRRRSAGGG